MTTINLAESQNLPFACLPRLYFLLSAIVALHLSRVLYKSALFMQNKPNLPAPKMNVTLVLTKDYENQGRLQTPAKQTQSNPISKALTPCHKHIEILDTLQLNLLAVRFRQSKYSVFWGKFRFEGQQVEPAAKDKGRLDAVRAARQVQR